ncbi:MAG: tripartite tricarboxylate transporter TctB family protein [Thermomicrobiales bacterium]
MLHQHHENPQFTVAEFAVALAVAVLGLTIVWTAFTFDAGLRHAGTIVGVMLTGIGFWYAGELLRIRRYTQQTRTPLVTCTQTDWYGLAVLAFALVAYAVLLQRAGFVLASTTLIVVAAHGLGSSRPLRDVVSAVAISSIVLVTFDLALGVELPGGLLTNIF